MGIESIMMSGENGSVIDIIKELFNKNNIEMKTELNDFEIGVLLEIKWHDALSKPENQNKKGLAIFMDEVVPLFLQLKVSNKRASRKEAENILKGILPQLLAQETSLAGEIKK